MTTALDHGNESWPPHIEIGPAGRVYYRRESVEAWLQKIESAKQEAQTAPPAGGGGTAPDDTLDERLWDGGDDDAA